MDPQIRHNLEKLAAASGIVSALGGAAYLLSRRVTQEQPSVSPQPDILNTDKLVPHKRLLINRTALSIICLQHPDRKKIMADLRLSKHTVDFSTGYLKHYGLIARIITDKTSGIPPHYVPTGELIDTLREPDAYPFIEEALQERIATKELPS